MVKKLMKISFINSIPLLNVYQITRYLLNICHSSILLTGMGNLLYWEEAKEDPLRLNWLIKPILLLAWQLLGVAAHHSRITFGTSFNSHNHQHPGGSVSWAIGGIVYRLTSPNLSSSAR